MKLLKIHKGMMLQKFIIEEVRKKQKDPENSSDEADDFDSIFEDTGKYLLNGLFQCQSCFGRGTGSQIAHLGEHRTCDWKLVGSVPGMRGGRASSPVLSFCVDSCLVSVPLLCYCTGT